MPGTRLFFLCFVLIHFKESAPTGRLIFPPQRSSLWRYGFHTPTNYDDNQLNCGGFSTQWEENRGMCGVCGDPAQGPFENEAGGKFALGVISEKYPTQTSTINVTVELTTFQKGFFEFFICPHDDPRTRVPRSCLERHPLKIEESGDRKFYPLKAGLHHLSIRLPSNMVCSQCVLQWHHETGNRWGRCANETYGQGCGHQTHFYNCADIAITGDLGDPASGVMPTFTETKSYGGHSSSGTTSNPDDHEELKVNNIKTTSIQSPGDRETTQKMISESFDEDLKEPVKFHEGSSITTKEVIYRIDTTESADHLFMNSLVTNNRESGMKSETTASINDSVPSTIFQEKERKTTGKMSATTTSAEPSGDDSIPSIKFQEKERKTRKMSATTTTADPSGDGSVPSTRFQEKERKTTGKMSATTTTADPSGDGSVPSTRFYMGTDKTAEYSVYTSKFTIENRKKKKLVGTTPRMQSSSGDISLFQTEGTATVARKSCSDNSLFSTSQSSINEATRKPSNTIKFPKDSNYLVTNPQFSEHKFKQDPIKYNTLNVPRFDLGRATNFIPLPETGEKKDIVEQISTEPTDEISKVFSAITIPGAVSTSDLVYSTPLIERNDTITNITEVPPVKDLIYSSRATESALGNKKTKQPPAPTLIYLLKLKKNHSKTSTIETFSRETPMKSSGINSDYSTKSYMETETSKTNYGALDRTTASPGNVSIVDVIMPSSTEEFFQATFPMPMPTDASGNMSKPALDFGYSDKVKEITNQPPIAEDKGKTLTDTFCSLLGQLLNKTILLNNSDLFDPGCVLKNKMACKGRGLYLQTPGMRMWCTIMCRLGHCISTLCMCSCNQWDACYPVGKFTAVTKSKEWCTLHCATGFCPRSHCKCP